MSSFDLSDARAASAFLLTVALTVAILGDQFVPGAPLPDDNLDLLVGLVLVFYGYDIVRERRELLGAMVTAAVKAATETNNDD